MSEFVEVKVQDLSGSALDWAVAGADGETIYWVEVFRQCVLTGKGFGGLSMKYSPSTDWSQGGRLIEKYKLDIGAPMENKSGPWNAATEWGHPNGYKGETPLIAACRAIVSSVLGDTVSVPKELLS